MDLKSALENYIKKLEDDHDINEIYASNVINDLKEILNMKESLDEECERETIEHVKSLWKNIRENNHDKVLKISQEAYRYSKTNDRS